jgi:hypothetical protein
MPIYMVTTIGHPAQGIFRRSAFERIGGYAMEIDHMNADRSLWFYLSTVSDYAYIRDKMCRIRVSADTQTTLTTRNFQHPVLCHLTINDFCRYAEQFGFPKVAERRQEALSRLARDCLTWAGGALAAGDRDTAAAFLDYSRLLDRDIAGTEHRQRLQVMYDTGTPDLDYIASRDVMFSARKRNYPPPDGYIPIDAITGEAL